MSCLQRSLLAALLFCAILGGLLVLAALRASSWLERPDALQKADAILVLGEDPTRAFAAADLYSAGLAPKILLSRPRRQPRMSYLESQGICVPWFEVAGHTILRNRGIPEEAIGTFGEDLISTVTEARAAAAALPRVHRVIVVTSPYHVRRARLIFRDQFRDAEVLFATDHYETLPRAWWAQEDSATHVIMEALKLMYYEAGGRMH
jgi:uncharacterized SAM-binding protein YcdF (DUF218 family)